MYSIPTETTGNKYIQETNPDGIIRDLVLTKQTYVKKDTWEAIEFEFTQVGGKILNYRFFAPQNEKAIAYQMDVLNNIYKAIVKPIMDPTTLKDVRFNNNGESFETFEEVFNFYNSKLNYEEMVPISLKLLYKANTTTKKSTDKYVNPPQLKLGGNPVASSAYNPVTLDISKDVAVVAGKEKYALFTSFNVIETEPIIEHSKEEETTSFFNLPDTTSSLGDDFEMPF